MALSNSADVTDGGNKISSFLGTEMLHETQCLVPENLEGLGLLTHSEHCPEVGIGLLWKEV